MTKEVEVKGNIIPESSVSLNDFTVPDFSYLEQFVKLKSGEDREYYY